MDFSLAAAELALGIDGKYAGGLDEVCSVVGTATARKLAPTFQTNDSDSAWSVLKPDQQEDDGERQCPCRCGNLSAWSRRPCRREGMNAVAPIWERCRDGTG